MQKFKLAAKKFLETSSALDFTDVISNHSY